MRLRRTSMPWLPSESHRTIPSKGRPPLSGRSRSFFGRTCSAIFKTSLRQGCFVERPLRGVCTSPSLPPGHVDFARSLSKESVERVSKHYRSCCEFLNFGLCSFLTSAPHLSFAKISFCFNARHCDLGAATYNLRNVRAKELQPEWLGIRAGDFKTWRYVPCRENVRIIDRP